jgi:hypothetical protein
MGKRSSAPSKKSKSPRSVGLFDIQETLTTAPCVPALRKVVEEWRNNGYKGATDTTYELLNYWFKSDLKLANGVAEAVCNQLQRFTLASV